MRSAQASRRPARTRQTLRASGSGPPRRVSGRVSPFGLDGVVLGRYRLVTPLGTGAFASVWLAVDERLEREVAVKIIPERRVIQARFEREAWAASRLSHPAIVTLYEAVAEEDAAYLVSELVKGFTLEEALTKGQLSDRDLVEIGVVLCDALAYAHSERIIHRDVKPSNILVPASPPAGTPSAKLTDFGVAHAIGGDSLTATGDVIGTPLYMAPEQAAGRPPGVSADLYSLALVVYEGLTGVNPLASISAAQRATPLGRYLPPLRRQRRDLPRDLGRGIDLALRPRPGERGSIPELREALELSLAALADEPGVVAAPWRPHRPGRATAETWAFTRVAEPELTAATAAHASPREVEPSRTGALRPRGSDPDRQRGRSDPDRQRAALPAAHKRAGAAATGAVLTGWLAAHVLVSTPLTPAAAALVAAGLMLALPRVGFALLAAGFVLLTAIQGHSGESLVIAVAALVPLVAAPRAEPLWALAGGAPLLGALTLGGAWPAVAARAATARSRAVLGVVGWLWLAVASPLSGGALYVTLPGGAPSRALWSSSIYDALHHVLGALLSSGAIAGAPVWGVAAVVLPLLVTRRSLLLDAWRVALWALLVVACTELAIVLTHVSSGHATIRGAVVGAIAASLVALAPSALTAWRPNHSEYVEARLP